MCRRIHTALASGKFGKTTSKDLGFLEYFATPIDGLDSMASESILLAAQHGEIPSYQEIATIVRFVQEYEVLFWDAVFAEA